MYLFKLILTNYAHLDLANFYSMQNRIFTNLMSSNSGENVNLDADIWKQSSCHLTINLNKVKPNWLKQL